MDEKLSAQLHQADEQLGMVTLVRGSVKGQSRWAYAVIAPSKYLAFREVQKKGGYNLRDYIVDNGILAQGNGENPPEDVRRAMEERGLNHHFERDWQQDADKAAQTIPSHAQEILRKRSAEAEFPLSV